MTKETISEIEALKTLLLEGPDHMVLAEMLGFVADRLMALDADQLCGAGKHERSAERANYRNGYRPRAWETRAGRIDLKIPKLRKGSYFPEFLEPRRAAEKAPLGRLLRNRLPGNAWLQSFRKPMCRGFQATECAGLDRSKIHAAKLQKLTMMIKAAQVASFRQDG